MVPNCAKHLTLFFIERRVICFELLDNIFMYHAWKPAFIFHNGLEGIGPKIWKSSDTHCWKEMRKFFVSIPNMVLMKLYLLYNFLRRIKKSLFVYEFYMVRFFRFIPIFLEGNNPGHSSQYEVLYMSFLL